MAAWMKSLRRRRGQGLSEYAILVALIAIASITIVTAFGNQIREVLFQSGRRLPGNPQAVIRDQVSSHEDSVQQGLNNWQ